MQLLQDTAYIFFLEQRRGCKKLRRFNMLGNKMIQKSNQLIDYIK